MSNKQPKDEEIIVLHKCIDEDMTICSNQYVDKDICNLSNELASEQIYHFVLRDVEHGDHIRLLCDPVSICYRDKHEKQWVYLWREVKDGYLATLNQEYVMEDKSFNNKVIDFLRIVNTIITSGEHEDE